jgi:hypothetical protein
MQKLAGDVELCCNFSVPSISHRYIASVSPPVKHSTFMQHYGMHLSLVQLLHIKWCDQALRRWE